MSIIEKQDVLQSVLTFFLWNKYLLYVLILYNHCKLIGIHFFLALNINLIIFIITNPWI